MGRFDAPERAPIIQLGDDEYLLELFHGPTLAFKDFAMQLLGEMFDEVLARQERRLTIIAATSGDTGAAAISALRHSDRVLTVVLHPEGRVTDVQRRMMTSVSADNVLNIAVNGSFDDCQAIVKSLFAETEFSREVALGGVNSINWARLAAQIVYYATAYNAIAKDGEAINFVVPTGNFGDVFAGYAAKRMGLPIARLGVATNANDILHRALTTGAYAPASVSQTYSPSMDIQVASNFERLLFDASGRNASAVLDRMTSFATSRSMQLTEQELAYMARDFCSYAVSEEETLSEIAMHLEAFGELIDPHTAVGLVAARSLREAGELSCKAVTLSTAHPAKFPEAVSKATGREPILPHRYSDLNQRPETFIRVAANGDAIANAIRERFKALTS